MVLFREIERFYEFGLSHDWNLFWINVVGNVVVFIPFGILVPRLISRCQNWVFIILLSLEFSFVIEVIQLLSRVGSFDVDDLLLNTLGGMCGYVIFRITTLRKEHRRKG